MQDVWHKPIYKMYCMIWQTC